MVSTTNPVRAADPLESNDGRFGPISSVAPLGIVTPVGSYVPPSVVVASRDTAPSVLLFQNPRNDDAFGCLNCGKNHHISIYQDIDPWEYRAPYYGSPDFGQGFYVIPDVEAEVQSLELLNYAQITVVRGEATFRDMEHEFQVWSSSMGYKWRLYVKVAVENQYISRFPNAKCIEELSHFGKFFMKNVDDTIIKIKKWAGDIEPFAVMEESWF
jgi:hypothetical protein